MPQALIISHGQPSAPDGAEAWLADLAASVAAHLPGWQVGSATLAGEGALARAAAGGAGVVFPLFMAGGWFTRVHLPKRLAEAGGSAWQVLEPLGCDPAVTGLVLDALREQGRVDSVILAAHGSGKSPAPSAIAVKLASRIRAELGIARVDAAFIDQFPRIADTRGHGPNSVCLPFFAAEGGHVSDDLPAQLAEAGFQGRILPALGLNPSLPLVIARAIQAGRPICAGACRAAAAD